MLFSRYGQAVLVAHERSSRFTLLTRQPSKAAAPVLDSLSAIFGAMPPHLRRTLTMDNGTEFAHHHRLTERFAMRTFFCDPHAPWQKGGVENAIGRLRRPLPRKADLAAIPQHKVDSLVAAYNNTPRRCLGYRTPNEVFQDLINRVALET